MIIFVTTCLHIFIHWSKILFKFQIFYNFHSLPHRKRVSRNMTSLSSVFLRAWIWPKCSNLFSMPLCNHFLNTFPQQSSSDFVSHVAHQPWKVALVLEFNQCVYSKVYERNTILIIKALIWPFEPSFDIFFNLFKGVNFYGDNSSFYQTNTILIFNY